MHDPEAVMRLRKMRIEAQRGFELGGRASRLAAEIQRRAEFVMQRRLVRRYFNPLAEGVGGTFPVAIVERLRPADFVSDGTLEQGVELQHQRIRRPDLARS